VNWQIGSMPQQPLPSTTRVKAFQLAIGKFVLRESGVSAHLRECVFGGKTGSEGYREPTRASGENKQSSCLQRNTNTEQRAFGIRVCVPCFAHR